MGSYSSRLHRVRSRLLEMEMFDKSHTAFCYLSVVTRPLSNVMSQSFTVSDKARY